MHKIIAITGLMGSGKTTALELIMETNYDYAYIKFAEPLYDIQQFVYDRIGREQPKPKDRKLLQWLGTDWGRSIDENLWVNVFRNEVRQAREILPPGAYILNDDTRFDNEAETIKDLGGYIVEVVASPEVRASRIELIQTGHASEKGIDNRFIDFKVVNNGTLDDLREAIKGVLSCIQLGDE